MIRCTGCGAELADAGSACPACGLKRTRLEGVAYRPPPPGGGRALYGIAWRDVGTREPALAAPDQQYDAPIAAALAELHAARAALERSRDPEALGALDAAVRTIDALAAAVCTEAVVRLAWIEAVTGTRVDLTLARPYSVIGDASAPAGYTGPTWWFARDARRSVDVVIDVLPAVTAAVGPDELRLVAIDRQRSCLVAVW